VVKVQFDDVDVSVEISPDVARPDFDAGIRVTLALRFDNHKSLLSDSFEVRPMMRDKAVRSQVDEASLWSKIASRVVQRRKSVPGFLI
jgi:hypothetical protein